MSFDHEWDVPDAEGLVVCVAVGVDLKSHKVRAERVFEVRLGQVLGLRVFEVWDLGVIGDPGEVPEHGRKVPVQILVQRPVREGAVSGEVELNVAEVDGVEVLLENVAFRHLVKAGQFDVPVKAWQFDVPNRDGWVGFGLRKSDGADGTRGSVVMHPRICGNLETKFNC